MKKTLKRSHTHIAVLSLNDGDDFSFYANIQLHIDFHVPKHVLTERKVCPGSLLKH